MSDNLSSSIKKWTLEEMLEPSNALGSPPKNKKDKALEWGFPGHLTQEELSTFVKFQKEVESRGGEFKNTVYSFTDVEGEAYTLTRWLRARKYNLKDTVDMVCEATECRNDPRKHDYYPDGTEALGVDPSIFLALYPQLYTGFSKTGCPVFYSKPGVINIDGIECITNIGGIIKYHWHVMQHDYKRRLLKFKEENPEFCRFECVSVLDLSGLTMSQLGSRTLDIIKNQAFIDSLCFPETMNKMVIVNAPVFFTATWSIIKSFIDVRTAHKVSIFSSTSAAKAFLLNIIDEDNLPSDYGGKATSTQVLSQMEAATGGRKRLVVEVLYVRGSNSFRMDLDANEEVDIFIHTRSTYGANIKVQDSNKNDLVSAVDVIHSGPCGDHEMPSKFHLTSGGKISGVSGVRIKAESLRTKMTSDTYLIVANVYKK